MSKSIIELSTPNIYPLRNKRNSFQKPNLNWNENTNVQKLLDAISAIIATEYIEIARGNRDVFSEIASPPEVDLNNQEINGGLK